LLLNEGKIKADKILLRFIGRFGNEVQEMFDSASFRDSIEIIGYIPHKESIKYLMLSDLLLLVVDESKESEEIVPGKVYEYIGTKIPVLAIAPKRSAIAELMNETKAGAVAHQSEIEKIAEIFLRFYSDWLSGESSYTPDTAVINSYERREAAKQLAGLLNQLTENEQ
jgi:glycosyltransferase involved in cell wall biosynthesis